MSEEVTPEVSDESAQAENFAALRAQKEALEAELRPLKVEKVVRDAGFDPTSGSGLALQDLLAFDSDVEAAKQIAAKYGWEPVPAQPEMTPEQRVVQSGSDRLASLASATTSDNPPDLANQVAELDQQIVAARAQGLSVQRLVQERVSLAVKAANQAGPHA